MRKNLSILMVFAVIVSLCTGCAVKSDETLIEERMDAFLMAYNSGDMEAVIACLDAKTRNTYKAAMNISSGLIGLTGFEVDIADLFGLGIGLMGDGDVLKLDDMKVTIISETSATVSATMQYKDPESSYSQSVTLGLVKEDGDWYISG